MNEPKDDPQDPFIVVNVSTTVPVEEPRFARHRAERSPSGLPLDESGAGQVAASLIRTLDKRFNRAQVRQIARWMSYLSTQD